ncbi:hypothetical protein K8I31_13800 [bacterium]|nr:hypothetical protein [bacterium]
MNDEANSSPWKEKDVSLQDIVISNSWALQAILEYLDQKDPGARDHIWQLYLRMKELSETTTKPADDVPPNNEDTEGLRDY